MINELQGKVVSIQKDYTASWASADFSGAVFTRAIL